MRTFALLVLGTFALAACDSSSGGGGGGGGSAATASGSVVKGTLSGADLTVFELLRTGVLGEEIGTGTTGADGSFDVDVGNFRGWAVVCASGGSYVDEATGLMATIDPAFPLYGFALIEDTSADYAVTPLTTIAYLVARTLAHDPNMGTDLLVANALQAVANYFGIPDPGQTMPSDPTAGALMAGPEADYGLMNAAFAQLALTYGADVMKLVHAIGRDLSDYLADGMTFTGVTNIDGAPRVPGAATSRTMPLPPSAATLDIQVAFVDWVMSPANLSGLLEGDTLVDDVLAANTGDVDKPPRITAVNNSYALASQAVQATLRGSSLPSLADAQVVVEARFLTVTSADFEEIGFDLPLDLTLGKHELLLGDASTGMFARIQDGIEAFDPFVQPMATRGAPLSGPLGGGTFFTLTGNFFSPLTQVTFGGQSASLLAADYPRYTVWEVPPGVTLGPVNVQVSNGSNSINLQASYEYKDREFRADASEPAPTDDIAFGGLRYSFDVTEGITIEVLDGTVDFSDLDFGSFMLYSRLQTTLSPVTTLQTYSGTAFQSTESIGKAFLLDRGDGTTDFIRGWTNEDNSTSAAVTAFGPSYFFPRASGASRTNLTGDYWINGLRANLALGTITQQLGWLELKQDGSGSGCVDFHGRDFAGLSFDYGREKWKLSFDVDFQGRVTGSRDRDGQLDDIEGWVSDDGSSSAWTVEGADGSLGFYYLIPVEYGLEGAGWGGWVGGQVSHELKDDDMGGLESEFEAGSYKGMISYDGTGQSQRLAFNRSTSIDVDDTGTFRETVDEEDFDVHPSGVMWNDDKIIGVISGYDGLLVTTGEFPNECDRNAGTDLTLSTGLATFRHSRQSFRALDGLWNSVSYGTSFRAPELTELFAPQQAFTRAEELTIDADTGPDFDGDEFELAATILTLAGSTPVGDYKVSLRDGNGNTSFSLGNPPQISLEAGIVSIDDTYEVFATKTTDAGSPFVGLEFPHWLWSGSLSGDGELGTFRGNDFVLGDNLLFLVKNDGSSPPEPTGSLPFQGVCFDPSNGLLTSVIALEGSVDFLGGGQTFVDVTGQTRLEDDTYFGATLTGAGLVSSLGGQRFRLNIPPLMIGDPDSLVDGVCTPSQDFAVGWDVTANLDVSLYLAAKFPITNSFLTSSKLLIGLESDNVTNQTTTSQRLFTPGLGQINLTGESFTSTRTSTEQETWPGQDFTVTIPSLISNDEGITTYNSPVLGQIPVLGFLFSDKGRAATKLELQVQLTPFIAISYDF